ncbi:type II toxin-antitoxin system RelE/ParE family toxin [Undibacterium sp. Xuan67W]|uniref:type II toxin-antitoxin system RelE/ParE family toxin n=1 Tax=Undibacterium sp. Xuan67W TaxID=3413057 RepID=UPI003BEFC57F
MSESIHDLSIIWSASAQKAFLETLERIENEDIGTARLVLQRVEKSMSLLTIQPGMGTFTAMPCVRRYAIPQTGHTVNYRVVHGELRILRWYRQRQRYLVNE